MNKLLEVRNVSVKFPSRGQVLHDVSFDIERGQMISLIGLNGSGKTTLLKAIVGLIKIDSGTIKKFTKKIFYIPQKSDLNTTFPITVQEFCKLFGAKDFAKYLERLNVMSLLDRKVGDLSGGEWQRILIAVALSRKPDLLLFDEVTAGIDLAGEESFYELVTTISKEYGIAVLIVSHNIHLVLRNSDQVLCLAGHLCCMGKPEDVRDEAAFQTVFGEHLQPYIHHHDHTH